MPSPRNPGQSHMRGWIGFLIPPPKGEGGPGGLRPPFLASRTPTRSVGYASAARRVGWGFPHPGSLRSPTLPRFAGEGISRAYAIAPHRDRRNRRACGAPDFEHRHNERELLRVLCYQLIELEVFEQMNAVHYQRDLVDRQRDQWIGIGRDLDRPIIGAKQHRILRNEPLRRLHPDAGA